MDADFTRKPSRHGMTRVMVAPTSGSKRRITWASFWLSITAEHFADDLRKANPTWTVEVRYPYVRCGRRSGAEE